MVYYNIKLPISNFHKSKQLSISVNIYVKNILSLKTSFLDFGSVDQHSWVEIKFELGSFNPTNDL